MNDLRMAKVLDRASGTCVFTKHWKWHPHAHAEGVDSLVLLFTQFAREIDGGDVVQIQFDTSSGSAISSNRSSISSSSASVRSSSDQTDDDSKRPGSGAVVRLALSIATALPRLTRAPFVLCCLLQPSSTAIMMQSVQDESLQAVLFHDRTISEDTNVALKQLLQQILEQFQSMHSAELSKLRPQLKSSATMTPKELEKLQSHFLPFMTELDTKLVPAFETSLLPKLMETSLVLRPMEAKMSGAQAGKSIQQQQQQEKRS